MKKKLAILLLFISHIFILRAQQNWQPVTGKIQTEWASLVNPSAPHNEYPRPQLVRKNWTNLNGLWQYAVTPVINDEKIPTINEGNILVPFAVESALSGVGKTVGKDSVLWYQRNINVTNEQRKGRLLLHFGAVDWQATVFVNGQQVGEHKGGYDPFYFDITTALVKGTQQNIVVKVWDPVDEGPQPRGKQVKKPRGIWYTPVTGIWQTVWLETVPDAYIVSTRQTPDIDKAQLTVTVSTQNRISGDIITVTAYNKGIEVATAVTEADDATISLSVPNPVLWTPETPFLYDLKITITRNGKIVDEAGSYFAMRKISVAKDALGIQRILLNNHFVFQYGPLDQGWWPDGLYTAPTDAALEFDIVATKKMGFNMIRKHVKVEPARWYYYADKLGILVWQDMPSGDLGGNVWDMRPGQISGGLLDKVRSNESENIFRTEWAAIIKSLYNFPSIVVWVPFNEAWGQFKTEEIVAFTSKLDNNRLINGASGGNYTKTGHILDIHNYPEPQMPDPEIFGGRQALVLGEFGGLGLPLEGHTWQEKNNWGYQSFKNNTELEEKYTRFINDIEKLIPLGLSAAIYTQTTDVEIETNGLLTYDRKIYKIAAEKLNGLHKKLYRFNK